MLGVLGVYLEESLSTKVCRSERGEVVSDNPVSLGRKQRSGSESEERKSKSKNKGTYPEAVGIRASHRVDGRARLVDEDGGHDMDTADEF